MWPTSYSATLKWIATTADLATDCLHREGRSTYSHKYMPHLALDYSTVEPGARYSTDHTQVDFWVRHRNKQIRPWLTVVLDARSRCVAGWHLAVTPNADTILAAFRMAFRDWAVPEKVHMDRGSDFTSRLITGFSKKERDGYRRELGHDWREQLAKQSDVFFGGVLGELGIDISEAITRHPWAKGQVERFYRTFEDQCAKTFITYCGRSSAHKPECLPEMRAGDDVPTLDEACQRIGEWIDIYHRTEHRGGGMDRRTPLAVWNTATRVRKAVESELLAMMQARGVYKVGPNGVSFLVAGTTLTYGGTSHKLRRLRGRNVFIRLDPMHAECCFAYTVDTPRTFVGRLECNTPLPVDTPVENLREAVRTLRGRNKDFDRAMRDAGKRQRTAGHEVAAMQREERRQLLAATGTDDARPGPDIVLVRTSFESASHPVRTAGGKPAGAPYADAWQRLVDFTRRPEPEPEPVRDDADIARALGCPWGSRIPPQDDGVHKGTDAHSSTEDIFALLVGAGHGNGRD